MGSDLILYGYWRSSAAYRVRIGLNLKGLVYRQEAVSLLRSGGEQHAPAYLELNPQGLVPLLVHGGWRIAQSLAILEYLDEQFAEQPLLPVEPPARALVRALALHIACDIHPLNNLRVLQYLEQPLGLAQAARDDWYRHWLALGLQALERGVEGFAGDLSLGEQPGYFEACLIPQLYNARRFACPLEALPRLLAIEARCLALPAFAAAAPERQADAPPA